MASITVTKQEEPAQSLFGGYWITPTGAYQNIEIRELGRVIVDGYDMDLRNAPDDESTVIEYAGTDIGETHGDYIRLTKNADGTYALEYWNTIGENDTPADDVVNTYTQAQLPVYIDFAQGVTEAPQTIIGTHPDNQAPPTYAEKQATAITAINSYRDQVHAWMLQAAERAHLHPDLVEKVGKWLRASIAALKSDFQNPAIDPLTVAGLADAARLGALDITDVDSFISSVHYGGSTPTNAVLWAKVSTDYENAGEVVRTNLANIVDYGDGTLPANFDSLAKAWLVANQVGKVVIDNFAPTIGDTLTATVSDPDGGLSAQTYQWQRADLDNDGAWEDITGETSATYTVVAADEDKALRVKSTYTDNYGPGQAVTSNATENATTPVL